MKKFGAAFLGLVTCLVTSGFFFPSSAMACSCMPFGEDFFETVFLHNQKVKTGEWPQSSALNIVVAEVDSHIQAEPSSPADMKINVIGSLQGNSCAKQVVLKGGDGASCLVPTGSFVEGKKYIFALNQNEAGEFYMSLCGNYFQEMASAPGL